MMRFKKEPRWVREMSAKYAHTKHSEYCATTCIHCGKTRCTFDLIDGECVLCFKASAGAADIDIMEASKERAINEYLEEINQRASSFPSFDIPDEE